MANLSDYIVNFTSLDTLNSVTGRGATTTNDITIGNLTSTGIDDNATSTAITIDASENVGIGTTSPDAVLHTAKTQASGDVPILLENSGTSGVATASLVFAGSGGGGAEKARIKSAVYGDGYMAFHTNDDSEKMRIDASGNLTVGGTTAGNAGSVNVSVGSPGSTVGGLQLWAGTSGSHFMQFGDTASGDGYYRGAIGYLHASDALVAYSAGAERMRIDSSGDVGIGTASPDAPLHIQTASGSKSEINLAQTAVTNYRISIPASTDALTFVYGASTERMRLDDSGRLLIGKTAVNNSTAGFMFESGSTGYAAFTNTGTASSHRVILCNRESGDGSLIDLQRAGSLKGNIGINGGDEPYFARSAGTATGIKIANGALTACQSDGTNHDNAQDLGSSSIRWRNFHMAGDAVMGASSNIIYESGTTFNVRAAVADLTFQTNGANERMRIDSSGNLLVGRTNTSFGAGTNGAFTTSGGRFLNEVNGDTCLALNRTDGTGSAAIVFFYRGNTAAGQINAAGGGTPAFASSSDIRLKNNVTDHESELTNVMSLRPVRWDWNNLDGVSGEGFIAQELEQTAWADLVSEGDDGYKQVSGLGAVETRLIKALQEAVTRIETLEAEVAALKGA